jgi:hypothetical protein
MIEATWVPWPVRSTPSPAAVKSTFSAIAPARSGWSVSTPVSSTATGTDPPVRPSAQAAGAPTSGTLTSMSSCATPSSHTFRYAVRRSPVDSRRQNAAIAGVLTRTAVLSIEPRSRAGPPPAAATTAARSSDVTISGRSPRLSS